MSTGLVRRRTERSGPWGLWVSAFSGLVLVLLVISLGGCPVEGPQGPQGPQGEQGPAGPQGPQGETGESGLDAPSVPGEDGTDGVDGIDGADGADGAAGQDGEDLTRPEGTPIVESVVDATGGLLVVGDKVRITGSSLDVDQVLVGNLQAPITAKTATQLTFQVPAGVPRGPNTVRLIRFTEDDTGFTEALAAIDVHRLAVLLGVANTQVVIVDVADQRVVESIDAPLTMNVDPPYRIGFANEGSLAIIPTGADNVLWVDLTDPTHRGLVALPDIDAGDLVLPASQGVAVSPDDQLAAVTDDQGQEQMILFNIIDHEPPYAAPLAFSGAVNTTNKGARSPVFLSDGGLAVAFKNENQVAVYPRNGAALNAPAATAAGDYPASLLYVPGRAQLHTAARIANSISAFLVGGGVTLTATPLAVSGVVTGSLLIDVTASPNGTFLYAVAVDSDRLRMVYAADTVMALIEENTDATLLSREQPRVIAVEPVTGDVLYVGFLANDDNGDYIDIFNVTNGTTLKRIDSGLADDLAADTDLKGTLGIGFQP